MDQTESVQTLKLANMQCTEVCILCSSITRTKHKLKYLTVHKVNAVDIHQLLSDSLVCACICVCVCVCVSALVCVCILHLCSNNHITLCSYNKTICIAPISDNDHRSSDCQLASHVFATELR